MAFLTLNQITVPVAASDSTEELTRKGGRNASIGGSFVNGSVGVRKKFNVRTTPMAFDEALGLVSIIEGTGHTIPLGNGFDGITGMNVTPGYYHCFFEFSGSAPNASTSGVLVCKSDGFTSNNSPAELQGMFSFETQFSDDRWTAIWYEAGSAGIWNTCARTSNSVGYINGSRDDHVGTCGTSDLSPVSLLSVSSSRGVFKFMNAANSLSAGETKIKASWIELIPEVLTSSQLASLTTGPITPPNTYPPFEKPFVTLRGDILQLEDVSVAESERMACLGTVVDFNFVPCYIDGDFKSNAVEVSFSLTEYEEAYANHV